jgi:hypothetical protein
MPGGRPQNGPRPDATPPRSPDTRAAAAAAHLGSCGAADGALAERLRHRRTQLSAEGGAGALRASLCWQPQPGHSHEARACSCVGKGRSSAAHLRAPTLPACPGDAALVGEAAGTRVCVRSAGLPAAAGSLCRRAAVGRGPASLGRGGDVGESASRTVSTRSTGRPPPAPALGGRTTSVASASLLAGAAFGLAAGAGAGAGSTGRADTRWGCRGPAARASGLRPRALATLACTHTHEHLRAAKKAVGASAGRHSPPGPLGCQRLPKHAATLHATRSEPQTQTQTQTRALRGELRTADCELLTGMLLRTSALSGGRPGDGARGSRCRGSTLSASFICGNSHVRKCMV